MAGGISSENIAPVSVSTEVLVNGPDGTGRQKTVALAQQVASMGPFADRLPEVGAIPALQVRIDEAGAVSSSLRHDLTSLSGDVGQQRQDIDALQSASLAAAPPFSTVEAALASPSVSIDGLFSVPVRADGIEYRVYRKIDGPTAVLLYEIPMAEALAEKASLVDLAAKPDSARPTARSRRGGKTVVVSDGINSALEVSADGLTTAIMSGRSRWILRLRTMSSRLKRVALPLLGDDTHTSLYLAPDGRIGAVLDDYTLADIAARLPAGGGGESGPVDPLPAAPSAYNLRAGNGYRLGTINDGIRSYDVRQPDDGALALLWLADTPLDLHLMMGQSNPGGGNAGTVIQGPVSPHTVVGMGVKSMAYGDAAVTVSETDLSRIDTEDWFNQSQLSHAVFGGSLGAAYAQAGQSDPGAIAWLAWEGGQPISSFEQGASGHYNFGNLIAGAAAAQSLAVKYGRPGAVSRVIMWQQGESGPTDRATYAGAEGDLFDDLVPAVRAATGQDFDPVVGIIQTNDDWNAGPGLAKWDNARSRSDCILIGPVYHCPISPSDEIHETGIGRLVKGDMLAYAYAEYTRLGAWQAPGPSSANRSGAVITVDFDGPEHFALSVDTDWIAAIAHYGVSYTDDSGTPPAISSVELTGPRSLRVTLASAPTGANKRVQFGVAAQAAPGWCARRTQLMFQTRAVSQWWRRGFAVPQFIRIPVAVSDISVN